MPSSRARTAMIVALTATLSITMADETGENPLVGVWEPAAEQPNRRAASLVDRLGQLEITPTHISAFGEKPEAYQYEQRGQVFRVLVDNPKATPLDFVLRDQNTLLMRLPQNVDVLWERIVTAETPAGKEPPAPAASDNLVANALRAAMPYALPTRFETAGKSLQALLDEGWSLANATGAGGSLTMLLTNDGRHIVCVVVPDLSDGRTATSDCRILN